MDGDFVAGCGGGAFAQYDILDDEAACGGACRHAVSFLSVAIRPRNRQPHVEFQFSGELNQRFQAEKLAMIIDKGIQPRLGNAKQRGSLHLGELFLVANQRDAGLYRGDQVAFHGLSDF